jgi:CRISPR-associated protein Cmr3
VTVWIIEPHDPLIVRDGRPFGPDPSARAISLSFPFPSTTTGGVRTRAGLKDGVFDLSQIERVKLIKVRGPLLVQLTPDGDESKPEQWLMPTPADALLLEPEPPHEGFVLRKWLVPLRLPEDAQTSLDTTNKDSLMLVGQVQPDPHKPVKEAPHYWYWNTFQAWLIAPPRDGQIVSLSGLGHSGPQREQRIHVSMNTDRRTAKEGALFETSGLEFTFTGRDREKRLSEVQRLALAVAVDENEAPGIRDGLASLGGERRMVSWRKSDYGLPQCPEELWKAIIKTKSCRVILLTPACFKQGHRPTWLAEQQYGVQPRLRAIAIQRPQVVSGWDLENKRPKPTRRLAPAGTVLFLSLEGSDEAIKHWVEGIWMQCVSDNEQDRNDGFGLAVLGTWSGQSEVMQEAK